MDRSKLYEVATEAIAEAMRLLSILADVTDEAGWMSDSVPAHTLDQLAQRLDHTDAMAVVWLVEERHDPGCARDEQQWMYI